MGSRFKVNLIWKNMEISIWQIEILAFGMANRLFVMLASEPIFKTEKAADKSCAKVFKNKIRRNNIEYVVFTLVFMDFKTIKYSIFKWTIRRKQKIKAKFVEFFVVWRSNFSLNFLLKREFYWKLVKNWTFFNRKINRKTTKFWN